MDGGGSMQSFKAFCLKGEERYRRLPLTFKTLTPEKGRRNISNLADYYPMEKTPHGLAVIINNEHFTEHSRREGTEVDEKNLIITFRYLGYNVEVYRDLTTNQIQELFENIQCRDHSASDSFVCSILTHGDYGRVFGTDSSSILIDTLTDKLGAANCPQLREKPKIFFIQACRGKLKCQMVSTDSGQAKDDNDSYHDETKSDNAETEDEIDGSAQISHDSPAPVCKLKRAIERSLSSDMPESAPKSRIESDSEIPDSADFFFGFATPSGQVAWRDLDHGSWYISELCRHLCTYCATQSLSDIMIKVHNGVGDRYFHENYKQAPETTHRLRKKVFF